MSSQSKNATELQCHNFDNCCGETDLYLFIYGLFKYVVLGQIIYKVDDRIMNE